MDAKTKKYLYIGGGVLLLILIIYFIGRRAGKRNAEGPKVNYPKGGEDIPASWSPEPLVKELHNAMDGLFTLSTTKDAAWKKLRDLPTDEMVIATYDVYNQRYFKDGKGTLVQWIDDEYYYDPTTGIKASTLARLRNLNLA